VAEARIERCLSSCPEFGSGWKKRSMIVADRSCNELDGSAQAPHSFARHGATKAGVGMLIMATCS